jgi:hypothetical protein
VPDPGNEAWRCLCKGLGMTDRVMRLGLVLLAAPALYTGIWAIVDPHGWFTSYPGFGHHWTAAYGTYNQHLATDTGAGFLAIGVPVLYAAFRMDKTVIRLALLVYLAFSIPHLVFHLIDPGPSLGGVDKALSLGLLIAAVVLPAVLLLMTTRMRTRRYGVSSPLLRQR